MKHLTSLCSLILAGTAISAAHAMTIFTDQASFLSQVKPGSYFETFDSLAQFTPLNSPLPFSMNGFGYPGSAPSAANDFFNVGPMDDVWLSTFDSFTSIVFNFTSSNVTAVGGNFFLTDIAGNVAPGMITVTLDDGTTFSISDPSATSFAGFATSSPMLSLTFTPRGAGEGEVFATANNFITGSVSIPDTGNSGLLFGMAISGIIFQRAASSRRRRVMQS